MTKRRRLILILVAVALVLIIAKAVLFFTTKPKITIDYIIEYNEMTFPENYDPNENAAPYYQKAVDSFVKMPRQLVDTGKRWLEDFNNTELVLFQDWTALNSQAFEQFKIGANKPYCWRQRQPTYRNGRRELLFPEKYPLRPLIIAFTWKTKQDAVEGRTQGVFGNLIDCYRAGRQQCRTPSLLAEQEEGLGLEQIALSATLVILDKAKFDSTTLKSFQDMLKTELDKDTYLPDLRAEKLHLYDSMQMFFADNDRGTGRMLWSMGKYFIGMCGQWSTFEVLKYCLVGPTRNQIVEQIDEIFTSFDSMKAKTPKQLNDYDRDYFTKIDMTCKDPFLGGFSPIDLRGIYYLYHRGKNRTEAVITIVAILRYKTDTGQYPESLDKLVSAGYLQSVPIDPYSDGLVVYKVTEDNFKLYSVGENFIDDGGEAYPADIVYWPVKRPEKPQMPSDAEKEMEATQGMQDPNQAK